jgi:transposase-like protein
MSALQDRVFHDPAAAREWLERLLWPEGPVCPHCRMIDAAYRMHNRSHRLGLYKCQGCEKQFTVTVGTIMDRSHLPLHKWATAILLAVGSKELISVNQLSGLLGITYKTAWKLKRRLCGALVPFDNKLGDVDNRGAARSRRGELA